VLTHAAAIITVPENARGLRILGPEGGLVMEAAIPVSILAIGLTRAYPRGSSLLDVIVTGIGGLAGSVVAGAIFTLPALYILKLDPRPVQAIFICLAGGRLGVLFLVPLRRYFVRDRHGLAPYPEATAITEVLVTGEKGGSQAKLLLQATAIAGGYDPFVATFYVWKECLDFQFVTALRTLSERTRMGLSVDPISFIPGLGYAMSSRSSSPHRPQDRLLAGIHARRAGDGEVSGSDRGAGGGGRDHRADSWRTLWASDRRRRSVRAVRAYASAA